MKVSFRCMAGVGIATPTRVRWAYEAIGFVPMPFGFGMYRHSDGGDAASVEEAVAKLQALDPEIPEFSSDAWQPDGDSAVTWVYQGIHETDWP